MINIDKILGGMVQSVVTTVLSNVVSTRTARNTGRSLGRTATRMNKKALGVGALGLAIAAYEHFQQGAGVSQPQSSVPPPQPGPSRSIPVPPTPPPSSPSSNEALQGSPEALILLRTMVAASSCDGVIDSEERKKIISALAETGLTAQEQNFVEEEFKKPHAIESIISEVKTSEMAEQVYTVASLAINIDHDNERSFMARLQQLLGLESEIVSRINSAVNA